MLGERLKIYCDYSGITGYRLAKTLGISTQSVSVFFQGKSSPSVATLEKIITAYPDLNANWLLTGRGEMLMKSPVGV